MDEFENVLCLCPSSRLSLASLVLATWTGVRRFVLTENTASLDDLSAYDAVFVMDRFVTTQVIRRLIDTTPVFVLAWNGLFEIEQYIETLGDIDVTYVGTDESVVSARGATRIKYRPLIDGRCAFADWLEQYERKTRFEIVGAAPYRARWWRARLLPSRPFNVMISTIGAARQLPLVRKTLASALISERLVWAGNCCLDLPALGLTREEQSIVRMGIAEAQHKTTAVARLRASLDLVRNWQTGATDARKVDPSLHSFYVTNTLLRWAVLAYLSTTAASASWFFGKDNLDLGLELELYVHNLVPCERVAFLELGGKTSESGLYPRALHLLARKFYVIPVLTTEPDEVMALLERIRLAVTSRRRSFFDELERRRRALYDEVPRGIDLATMQQRVWNDFSSAG